MTKKTLLIIPVLVSMLTLCSVAKSQEAYSALSNEGYYGFYNLLSNDLGSTCKTKKSYFGVTSKLSAGKSDGTTIYSFLLAPATGKKITISMILSDSEISPVKVKRFLTNGRKIRVIAKNCDGQITAVQIVSALPMENEP